MTAATATPTRDDAIAVPQPNAANRLRWLASDTMLLARRNLEHVRQIPEKLLDVTLQPIMFVLLFAYVFGGVIAVPGGDYKEYLVGGILVQTICFGMMGPGVSIATDLQEGIVDRFRSLPISKAAYLLGHVTAELAAVLLAITVLSLSGLVVGWQINTDVASAIGGYALLFLFAIAMVWTGTLVGVMVRSPDAVMGIAFMIVFPLTFVATTFVPAEGLPNGLQQVAEWNPVSTFAAAVRDLFGNPTATPADPAWPLQHPVISSVIWCLVILAVTIPLTVNRFQAKTTD
jgi:ABC transporter DrrB family efflux protein